MKGKDLAAELGVTPAALSQAVKNRHFCAGHPVWKWAERERGRVKRYDVPPDVLDDGGGGGGEPPQEAAAPPIMVRAAAAEPISRVNKGELALSKADEALFSRVTEVNEAASIEALDGDQVAETAADGAPDETAPPNAAAWVVGGLAVVIGIPWLLSRGAQNTGADVGSVPQRGAVNSPPGKGLGEAPAHRLGDTTPAHRPRPLEQPRTIVGVQLPSVRIWEAAR